MVRVPLTPQDHERGRRLGEVLRAARGSRSMTSVAAAVGMSPESLRKIETGRVPTPAFFTVAALCGELGVALDQLALDCEPADPADPADPAYADGPASARSRRTTSSSPRARVTS